MHRVASSFSGQSHNDASEIFRNFIPTLLTIKSTNKYAIYET